jgi:glycosyltransferase involved in cell wall biosynthesis
MAQIRLAIFISSMRGGGAQRAMLNLAQGIARRGYAVDLVLARAEGPYLADVPASVRVVDLKAARVLSGLPALIRYLRRERPQAMVSALAYVNIVALWARRMAGVPLRMIVNEQNTLSYSASHSQRRRARLMPALVKRYYPWADGVVTVSEGVGDDLARVTGIPREAIKVIYNPAVMALAVQERAKAPLDHPWFKPGQPPVMIAVGRFHVQKDFLMLIQAFAQVRKAQRARLLILGEGRERPMLEALVQQLGVEQDVSLPGFVTNPFAYMARATLFVLSSRWEGLPTVLVEALCCGTPVIATDCPSGPREILREQRYGQLVPVGDTAAMAAAITKALENTTPRPPRESWLPFELEVIVDQYLKILLED